MGDVVFFEILAFKSGEITLLVWNWRALKHACQCLLLTPTAQHAAYYLVMVSLRRGEAINICLIWIDDQLWILADRAKDTVSSRLTQNHNRCSFQPSSCTFQTRSRWIKMRTIDVSLTAIKVLLDLIQLCLNCILHQILMITTSISWLHVLDVFYKLLIIELDNFLFCN